MMSDRSDLLKNLTAILLLILLRVSFDSVYAAVCEYSIVDSHKLYNYSLATPTRDFPHGILSEDGFYKVAANDTIVWFQLCDGMIFNHDSPRCVGCSDCGGPLHCGMGCNGLVANNIGGQTCILCALHRVQWNYFDPGFLAAIWALFGYYVCTAIGRDSNFEIRLLDADHPHKGVIVKMASSAGTANCSLSVSVICDLDGVKGPQSLQKLGSCDYAAVLHHPAGCATIISVRGGGWGWFGTLLTISLFGLGAYLVAGAVYRYFFLGIHGIDVLPNLEFWTSLPHRTQSFFMSLVHRFRGPTHHHRNSYSPVNF